MLNVMPEAPWRAVTLAAGRARAQVRHWILGPDGERVGHFPSFENAQAEANKRNEALQQIATSPKE